MTITVIGLGTMGTAAVTRLIQCGIPTNVWNRSKKILTPIPHSLIQPLIFEDISLALSAATHLVLFCVTNLAAVQDILSKYGNHICCPVVTLVSGTPQEGRDLVGFVNTNKSSLTYVDGSYCGPPTSLATGTGIIVVSSGSDSLRSDIDTTLRHLGVVFHTKSPGAARALAYAITDHAFAAFLSLYGNAEMLRREGVPMDAYFSAVARRLQGVPQYLERLWKASGDPAASPTVSIGTYSHYFGTQRRSYAENIGASTEIIDFASRLLQKGKDHHEDIASLLKAKL